MNQGRHTQARTTKKGIRQLVTPMVLLVCGFLVASSGAAFAYWSATASGSASAKATSLSTPGTGTAGSPTTSTLAVSWGASSGLPAGGGYVVLRSTTSGSGFAPVGSGTCSGTIATTSCTDSGLTANTPYFYEVEAVVRNWLSSPNTQFSGTTSGIAPSFTSGNSTTFTAGTAGSFPVTTSGAPAVNSITNASNGTCTISSYPTGVAFNHTSGASTASITSTTASPAGSYTFCLTASSGVSPNATQTFTLIILGPVNKLVLAAQNTTTTAGVADNLTITAEDSGGNTVPTYTGLKNLTFTGANVAPNGTTHPTVTNSSGTAVNFGNTTAITFTNGLAQVSGSNNGVMTLFMAETALIKVSDGTISNGIGLSVTVVAAGPASLTLANCVVGSSHVCSGSFALGNGGNLVANVQALDTWGNGATISTAINMSVASASPSNYTITAGSTLTINGTATPPNQSTTTFTVQKNGNANNNTTITVHVTSLPSLPDLTFTVTK